MNSNMEVYMLYPNNNGLNAPHLAQAFNPLQPGVPGYATGPSWQQGLLPQLQQQAPQQQLQVLQQLAQQQFLVAQQLAQQAAALQAAAQHAYQQVRAQMVVAEQNQIGNAIGGGFTQGLFGQNQNLPNQFQNLPNQFQNLPNQFLNPPNQFGQGQHQFGQGQNSAIAGQPFGYAANWQQQPVQQALQQLASQQFALQQLLAQQQQQAAAQGLLGNSLGGQFAPLPGQLGTQQFLGGIGTLH